MRLYANRRLLLWGLVAAALAGYVVLLARLRPLVWKLADQTFCLADWEGFCETALPGLYPGAVLRWVSSLLMTTGLLDGWWWVPYVLLPLVLCIGKVRLAPFLLTSASLLHLGTRVWQLTDYAFPLTNLLGMCVVVGLFVALRPLCCRGWWGMLVSAGLCSAVFIPCGFYALFAGGLLVVERLIAARRNWKGWVACAGTAALLVLAPVWVSAWVYDDVAVGLAIGASQSVLSGALLDPFGFWPVIAFGMLGWELVGADVVGTARRAVRQSTPSGQLGEPTLPVWRFGGRLGEPTLPIGMVLCGLVFLGLPPEEVRPQLRMERLMLERRYTEALADDDTNENPLRMSLAYRVLALWRTGRLENDLFRRPFTSFHRSSPAQGLKMGGEWLLFEYGFLLPARQQTMELVSARGWQPRYLQLMGDVAFLTGESALAMRNWRQLARCPFRGELAQRRLAAVTAGKGLGDPAFTEFRSVMMLNRVWDETLRTRSEPPFFYFQDSNVENFVYGRCLTVVSSPPPEVARLILAVYLLEKDAKALVGSRGIMDALCPQGTWPRLWQQGMLACLGACDAAERNEIVASLRAGVFSQEEVTRYDAFVADLKKAEKTPVDFFARYGDTYYFYDAFVR